MSKVWDDNPIDLDCVFALFLKMKKVSALTNTHIGRSDRIRTCDLMDPNHAHYQTVPHPDKF